MVWVLVATSMLPNVAVKIIASLLGCDFIHCEFVVFKRLMWKKSLGNRERLRKGINLAVAGFANGCVVSGSADLAANDNMDNLKL